MKTFHTLTHFLAQPSSQTRPFDGQLTNANASDGGGAFRAQAGRVPSATGQLRRGVLLAGIACASLGVAGCAADSASSASPASAATPAAKPPISQMSHHPRGSSAVTKKTPPPSAAVPQSKTPAAPAPAAPAASAPAPATLTAAPAAPAAKVLCSPFTENRTPAALALAPLPRVMTIAALVEQTLGANPEIRFYENEIALAQKRADATTRWDDPELSVEIGRKSAREPGGGGGDGLAWRVSLAQKFDFSGRAALRKTIAACQTDRASAGLAQFRRELAAKTAELGHTLLAAQQRLDAAETAAARGRALLENLVQRDPADVAAMLEARVIEADVLKMDRAATLQRVALQAALAELNMLRGVPPETPLTLVNDTAVFADAPADTDLAATAFRDNYTLRQFELDLREQGVAVDLEQREGFGSVTLAPYIGEERAGGVERSVGIGVSIPLPLWNANRAGVAEARSRRGQAESALFKARRDLHRDVLAAAANYRASLQILADAGRAKVAQFQQAAELAERHYRLGTIPVSTYLALQQACLDAVENHTATRVEAVQAAAKLTVLTGLPVESFFAKAEPQTAAPTPAVKPHADDDHDDDHGKHDAHNHAAAPHSHAAAPHSHDHGTKPHAAPASSAVRSIYGAKKQPPSQPPTPAPHADDAHDHDAKPHSDHADHDGHAHAAPANAAATFSEDHGLKLAPDAAKALDIRTAPVARRVLKRELRVVAQIYAAATATAPARAVAVVAAEQAAELALGTRATVVVATAPSPAATLTAINRTAARVELAFDIANIPTAAAPAAAPATAPTPAPAPVGSSVALVLPLADTPSVVAVPRTAVLETATGAFAYVVRDGGHYQRVAVKLGAADAANGLVEIASGLREGDTIVLAPVNQLWLAELRLTKGGGHSH